MHRFGLMGCIVGLFALAMAVLPIWILPAVFPPKPIDAVIAETTEKVKERLIAKAAGTYIQVQEESSPARRWHRAASISSVVLGLGAIALGVVAFLRREDRRYVIVALGLGALAIAFEVILIGVGVAIALLFIGSILSFLGFI